MRLSDDVVLLPFNAAVMGPVDAVLAEMLSFRRSR
jgi:hypothetical protein